MIFQRSKYSWGVNGLLGLVIIVHVQDVGSCDRDMAVDAGYCVVVCVVLIAVKYFHAGSGVA